MGGLAGPPGPARPGAETERSDGHLGRAAARGVLLPALVALVNGMAFVAVYLAAFHHPVPHDLPLGVVAPAAQAAQVRDQVTGAARGQFTVAHVADPDAAAREVQHRHLFGVLVLGGPQPQLLVAGANGQGVTQSVTQAFAPALRDLGQPPQVRDLRPLVPGDSRGLAVFYTAFGVVLGGFLFGIASFQAAPHLVLRYRLVSVLLFAAVGGLVTAWLAVTVYAAVPAAWLLVAGVVALLGAACAATAAVLFRLLGSAGQIPTSIGLVILGNATSTGNLPAQYLPPWMEPLASVLPPGVAVRALRGASYFADDGVPHAWVVLSLWALVPLLVIAAVDAVGRRRRLHARR